MTDSEKRDQYATRLKESNLPTALRGRAFEAYKELKGVEAQNKIRKAVISYAENFSKRKTVMSEGDLLPKYTCPNSILFIGANGTGKTFLAGCLANELMFHKGMRVGYAMMDDIVLAIQAANNFKSHEDVKSVLDEYLYQDLLILDEVGASTDTITEGSALHKIFDNRLSEYKPTLLISNLNKDELGERFGMRLRDRLDFCKVCYFKWDSMRNQNNRTKYELG